MNTVDCKFCDIFDRQQTSGKMEHYYDKILWQNDHWFVVPANGAFVENYLLIISKRHMNAAAYSTSKEMHSLHYAIRTCKSVLNTYETLATHNLPRCRPIVFEHGSTDDRSIAVPQSIHHAHIHVLPAYNTNQILGGDNYQNELSMEPISTYPEFFEKAKGKPYIFYIDQQGQMQLKILDPNEPVRSQEMRIRLARAMVPANNFNWREELHENNIQKTMVNLKSLFRDLPNLRQNARLKHIYYARAMDGLCPNQVADDYSHVAEELAKHGMTLCNSIADKEHTLVPSRPQDFTARTFQENKRLASFIVNENSKNILKSDALLTNMTRPNHPYVGCIAEIIDAHRQGTFTVTACGPNYDYYTNNFYMVHHNDAMVHTVPQAIDILVKENDRGLN